MMLQRENETSAFKYLWWMTEVDLNSRWEKNGEKCREKKN
jgi:hypothetical protein